MDPKILSKLTYIITNKKQLTSLDIAQTLADDLIPAFKYIYHDNDLFYQDLDRFEQGHTIDIENLTLTEEDSFPITKVSIKPILRRGINWPEIFDITTDLGFIRCSSPRGKKDSFTLNKPETGSEIINLILSNYSDSCNYDIIFSPVFALLRLDSRFDPVSRRMFGSDSMLITLNAVSRKYFSLLPNLSKWFKATTIQQRFRKLSSYLREKGINQQEIYVLQTCFIESFLHGIHRDDNFDVNYEYKTVELLDELHSIDGSQYPLEWYQPLKP